MNRITKEQFEKAYCERSNITLTYYHSHFVALPCACDYEQCEGWASVTNDADMIAAHMRFYAPRVGQESNGSLWNGDVWVV